MDERARFVQHLGLILGDYAEVEAGLDEVKKSYEARGNPLMGGCLALCMSGTAACRRDWETFDAYVDQAVEALERFSFVDIDMATMACVAGDLAREGGRLARAARAYRFGADQLEGLKRHDEAEEVRRLVAALDSDDTG